jgi:hypothetical protein
MKKLLFIFTLFLSLAGVAQKPSKFQDVAARYSWLGGNFYQQLGLPKDTFAVSGVDTLFAWFARKGEDSIYLYKNSLKKWVLFQAGSGEVNTSSNVGGGVGLAKAKVGLDLPFKSLVAGPGISLTSATNTVTINSTITQYTDSLAKSSIDLVNGLIYNPTTGIGKLGGFLTQNTLFVNRNFGFDFGTNTNRLDHFAVYTKANIFLGDSTTAGSTPSVFLHNGITEINGFNTYLTADHQLVLTGSDSVMLAGIGNSVDTTKYKPLARAANGKVIQFTRWPGTGGGGVSTNIYTANGTLAGDRIVAGGSHDLTFNGIANYNMRVATDAYFQYYDGTNSSSIDLRRIIEFDSDSAIHIKSSIINFPSQTKGIMQLNSSKNLISSYTIAVPTTDTFKVTNTGGFISAGYDAGFFTNIKAYSLNDTNQLTFNAFRSIFKKKYDNGSMHTQSEIITEADNDYYNTYLEGSSVTGSQSFIQMVKSVALGDNLIIGYNEFKDSSLNAQRIIMNSGGTFFTGNTVQYNSGSNYLYIDPDDLESYVEENTTANKWSDIRNHVGSSASTAKISAGYGSKTAQVSAIGDINTLIRIDLLGSANLQINGLVATSSISAVMLVLDTSSNQVYRMPIPSGGGGGGTTYTADESTLHLASTVFSIKSTYAGQTSLTTLGTITTGTWNAGKLTATLTTEQFRAAYDVSNYTTTTVASTGETTYDIVGSAQQFIWSQDMAEYGTITRFKMGEAAIYPEGLQLKYNGGSAISYITGSRQLEIGAGTGDPESLANGGKINIFSTGTGTVAIGAASTGAYKLELTGTILVTGAATFSNYSGTGNQLAYFTSAGAFGRSGVDPAKIPYSLITNITNVGNIGTGEDNLMTGTIPAGQLATNGDKIEFEMEIGFAANTNTKQIKVYFGSTVVMTIPATGTSTAGGLTIRGTIIRVNGTNEKVYCTYVGNSLHGNGGFYVEPTETLSGALTLKATGEATATDDIIQTALTAKYIPN